MLKMVVLSDEMAPKDCEKCYIKKDMCPYKDSSECWRMFLIQRNEANNQLTLEAYLINALLNRVDKLEKELKDEYNI